MVSPFGSLPELPKRARETETVKEPVNRDGPCSSKRREGMRKAEFGGGVAQSPRGNLEQPWADRSKTGRVHGPSFKSRRRRQRQGLTTDDAGTRPTSVSMMLFRLWSQGQWLKPPTVRWVPKRCGLRPIVTMAQLRCCLE